MNAPTPLTGQINETTASKRPQIGQSQRPAQGQNFNNVRPESLVQNQIGNVLNQDNDYMRQAASVGRQQANARGIQDSTMGIEAVRNAQISAALPIAQQDASIYGQADLQQNAFQQNQQLQTDQFGYNTQLADQQFGFNTQLAEQQFGYNQNLAELNSSLNLNNNMALNNNAHIQSLQQSTQQAINQINSDVSLSPEQRQQMINNIIADFNNQVQFSQAYTNNFNAGADQLASSFNFQGMQTISPPAAPAQAATQATETQPVDPWAGIYTTDENRANSA